MAMAESAGTQWNLWRGLELLAVLVLSVSILGLFAMRLGVFHAWPVWILGTLAVYAYASRFPPSQTQATANPPAWHVVVILLVALLFRLTPYVYQLGGQDEGVYTNMAAYLVHTGSLQPLDAILHGITNSEAREAYVQGNYTAKHYLPGVYGVKGGLEFQFYHLFPVWLALFGDILGVDKMGYGLTFLSLVSLLFFQRLAHVITGSAKAGLAAGLLLAVNPLHAFFSKFPVTEIPTLAFSLLSFTFLVTQWKEPQEPRNRRYLVLSVLALAALFMTRISGFMYLPVLLSVFFLALLIDRKSKQHRDLILWAGAGLAFYVLSIGYGLEWSRVYAVDIYNSSFEPLLGKRWPLYVAAFSGALVLGWLGVWYVSWEERRQATVIRWLQPLVVLLPLIIAAATLIACWKAYRLGFTDTYASHPWYGTYFKLSHRGAHSLRSISVIAAALYVSPLLLLAFYLASLRRRLEPVMAVLLVFITAIYCYVAILQWVVPYQPYYARYLVSEFIPYILLFVVASWSMLKPGALRRFLGFSLLVCGLWGATLSVTQIGKDEHAGVAESLTRLSSRVDPNDMVFVDTALTEPFAHELKTALVYTYGLKIVTVTPADLKTGGYANRIASPYHDVFYLSRSPVAPQGFTEVDSVDFVEKNYCHGSMPPTELCVRSDSRLMLFKRTTMPPPVAGDLALAFSGGARELGTQVGSKKDGKLVADGRSGFVMYGPYAPLSAGKYTLEVKGASSKPFTLDMVASRGRDTLYRDARAGSQDAASGLLLRADFEVKESVTDLEVRIHVPAGSDLSVDGYRIINR